VWVTTGAAPLEPPLEPLVRVTTGAGLEPGVAAAVPLEEVVTGAEEEEYEGEEPADEAPVETPPLDPAPLALPYAAAAPAAPAPAPTRCFGLTCLVTWIVRLNRVSLGKQHPCCRLRIEPKRHPQEGDSNGGWSEFTATCRWPAIGLDRIRRSDDW
jgi:hypothetical protein